MTRFNEKIGAVVLLLAATLYAVLALATAHSAVAEPPPDLRADGAGLDVWKSLALLAREGEGAVVVDLRPEADFARFHIPGAQNLPGADTATLARAVAKAPASLLVASSDAVASRTVAELKAAGAGSSVHFLRGGIAAWYLQLALPVPLFSDKPPPSGYEKSLGQVRSWLEQPATASTDTVIQAITTLAKLGYEPTSLGQKHKPKASAGKKKITGGCG